MRNTLKKLFCLLTIIITSFLLIGTQLAFATQTGYDFGKYGDASFEPIPAWIKNNAGWWAEGKIFDTPFLEGIEWLITNGIISVSVTEQETKSESDIPAWIKNNAGWWAEGKIPDTAFISGLEWLIEHGIIVVELPEYIDPYDVTFAPILTDVTQANLKHVASTFFHVFGDLDTITTDGEVEHWGALYLGLNPDKAEQYKEVEVWNDPRKMAVIYPFFTSTAYGEPGFYTYYRGECDACTTISIKPARLHYPTSGNAIQAFSLMGYDILTDLIVDQNPSILEEYDKIIMLHNEYVTRGMFDAITNHPNVIYLYPNALYGEIEVDYVHGTITLIRGHGYPEPEISNGFDWEFDNTHPYEYDNKCLVMKFYEIDNGLMTNCYPENVFVSSTDGAYKILKAIKEL